jgi:hypothetical protein
MAAMRSPTQLDLDESDIAALLGERHKQLTGLFNAELVRL